MFLHFILTQSIIKQVLLPTNTFRQFTWISLSFSRSISLFPSKLFHSRISLIVTGSFLTIPPVFMVFIRFRCNFIFARLLYFTFLTRLLIFFDYFLLFSSNLYVLLMLARFVALPFPTRSSVILPRVISFIRLTVYDGLRFMFRRNA